MIKKITNQNQIARHKLAEKINELVDAVNVLQAQVAILEEHAHPTAKVYEESQDMFDNAILDGIKDKKVDVIIKPDGDDAIQEVIHTDSFADASKKIEQKD